MEKEKTMNNLINFILGKEEHGDRESCFNMVLKAARQYAGFDVATGEADNVCEMQCNILFQGGSCDDALANKMLHPCLFSGILLYLVLLEQIGTLFRVRTYSEVSEKNGIKAALKMFAPSLTKDEVEAINDLRNSLAHNLGLATELNMHSGKRKKHHLFTLDFNQNAELIVLPEEAWDGDFEHKYENNMTKIGVFAFCKQVETIVRQLKKLASCNDVELRLSEAEVKARFTIFVE